MAIEPPSELAALLQAFRAGDYRIEGEQLDEPGPGHHGPATRAVEYRGHQIEITTRYEIAIDGEPWPETENLQVLHDGTVHYHALPQYSPASMVELMKAIVDAADLAGEATGDAYSSSGGTGRDHGDHDHGDHDHGDHDPGDHDPGDQGDLERGGDRA